MTAATYDYEINPASELLAREANALAFLADAPTDGEWPAEIARLTKLAAEAHDACLLVASVYSGDDDGDIHGTVMAAVATVELAKRYRAKTLSPVLARGNWEEMHAWSLAPETRAAVDAQHGIAAETPTPTPVAGGQSSRLYPYDPSHPFASTKAIASATKVLDSFPIQAKVEEVRRDFRTMPDALLVGAITTARDAYDSRSLATDRFTSAMALVCGAAAIEEVCRRYAAGTLHPALVEGGEAAMAYFEDPATEAEVIGWASTRGIDPSDPVQAALAVQVEQRLGLRAPAGSRLN